MLTTTDPGNLQPGDHVVQFYDRDPELVESVGDYLAAAVRSGDAAIAIATPAHRAAFVEHLSAAGIDVEAAERGGHLLLLDAQATLAQFMPAGRLDGDAFREVVGGVIEAANRDGRAVYAFGEMVALLWEAGDVIAAIDLERLWNDLAGKLPFRLYCAYRSESVAGHEHADALHDVCGLHAAVVPPSPGTGEATADLPVDLGSAARARHLVADAVRGWGHSAELVADAELIATELATNAILHARTPFRVSVVSIGPALRIGVRDSANALPALLDPGPQQFSGRGMYLIGSIARRWGVEVTAAGKTVWAELGR